VSIAERDPLQSTYIRILVRLAGGITVIVLAQDPTSVGLIIAATILLGVGVPPLLIATMNLVRTA